MEVAPRILPRMVDEACAGIVDRWLRRHGVEIRAGATVTRVEEVKGKRKLSFKTGAPIVADAVIMATGIRTNLEWLKDSGIEMAEDGQGGIVVDDHLRSSVKNVYAAGDVARGKNLVTGAAEVHAIEPTAQEHGRVVGANMAGRDVAYRGSLLMNIVEVCHLDVASFGQWDDKGAEVFTGVRPERSQYRKLLFRGGRLTGAMICGPRGGHLDHQRRGHPQGSGPDRRGPVRVEGASRARSLRRQAGLHGHADDGGAAAADHPRPAFPFTPLPQTVATR